MFPRWLSLLAGLGFVLGHVFGLGLARPVLAASGVTVTAGAVTVLETAGDIHAVVVAVPEIADATVTAPRKLFLLGRKSGRTGLLVIGADGAPLLETTVTVAPSDAGLVTLDRGTKESTLSCTPRCVEADPGKSSQGNGPAPVAAPVAAPAGAAGR